MNDLQGRPHGALGVFFVRGGPAEIGQDAITHVAGDKPVVARDHIAAEGSIRVQQAAQLFGVELFTQRRRTHQVAEHHGELAAFATVRHRIFAERSRTAVAGATTGLTASVVRCSFSLAIATSS